MNDLEEIQEVRQQIKDHLASKVQWLEDHWFEAHEDLVRDQLIENMHEEPHLVVDRLAWLLDNAHRKLYPFLSGDEIVGFLRAKMTDDQILDELIDLGEAYEGKTRSVDMRLSSWNPNEIDEEVFTDEDDELALLVKLLPDDSLMKKQIFTVNVDVGPFYFCVEADPFLNLKTIGATIDSALADEYMKSLLETGSHA